MAGLELQQTTRSVAESVDIAAVLDEFRIVIEQSFHESNISIRWEQDDSLPRVWADRQALLQVFLNVAKNSQRALDGWPHKEFIVQTSSDANSVIVRLIDTGRGVANPQRLFSPFQPGAQASGLGLYLSRAFMRAFHGDLEFEPRPEGACFAVILALAGNQKVRIA